MSVRRIVPPEPGPLRRRWLVQPGLRRGLPPLPSLIPSVLAAQDAVCRLVMANLGAAAGLLLAARAHAADAEWFWVAGA